MKIKGKIDLESKLLKLKSEKQQLRLDIICRQLEIDILKSPPNPAPFYVSFMFLSPSPSLFPLPLFSFFNLPPFLFFSIFSYHYNIHYLMIPWVIISINIPLLLLSIAKYREPWQHIKSHLIIKQIFIYIKLKHLKIRICNWGFSFNDQLLFPPYCNLYWIFSILIFSSVWQVIFNHYIL